MLRPHAADVRLPDGRLNCQWAGIPCLAAAAGAGWAFSGGRPSAWPPARACSGRTCERKCDSSEGGSGRRVIAHVGNIRARVDAGTTRHGGLSTKTDATITLQHQPTAPAAVLKGRTHSRGQERRNRDSATEAAERRISKDPKHSQFHTITHAHTR